MRWRILMTIFGLIAAIALLFFAVNFFVVQQAVRAYNEVHSQAHTELIPSLLTLHYANFGSWEGVEMELVQLNVIAGTEVTIVDQDGTIVVSSGPDIPGDRFITRSDISREIPIFDEAGEKVATAYVQLSLSSQTIDRAFFGDLMQGSTVSIAIAAVVGMVIATLLAGSISRPIQRIDQAARSLILGDYKTRIPTIEHRDEIASLAETFNQMADGLEATETLRRKLVADLSHDFRTPLTVLNGYVEGLADGRNSDRATAMKVFERMSTEIDYLNRHVDGLSHSARWDSGRLISEPAPVDV
ncbi:MAG: HAMP domain-containing protein, partial [Chloroflexota bacterium]